MFSDRITLRTVTSTIDSAGYTTETNVDRVVWADKQKPTMNEFYKANEHGFEASATFIVRDDDYHEEKAVLHGTQEYDVIRTFFYDKNRTGLVCSNKAV
jgi:SPP1 family predicted phage head-tail adaptor